MPVPEAAPPERARRCPFPVGNRHRDRRLTPTPLPAAAQARYVDLRPVKTRAEHYSELNPKTFVRVDVIDDGERLARFADASLDFLVANHMLEHCENPLGTMRNHLRKVKPGGILFYAMPDMRIGFDQARQITPFEHVVADDRDGGESLRRAHHLNGHASGEGITDDAEVARIAEENPGLL
jgi:SAM-dependent methyltransferase